MGFFKDESIPAERKAMTPEEMAVDVQRGMAKESAFFKALGKVADPNFISPNIKVPIDHMGETDELDLDAMSERDPQMSESDLLGLQVIAIKTQLEALENYIEDQMGHRESNSDHALIAVYIQIRQIIRNYC